MCQQPAQLGQTNRTNQSRATSNSTNQSRASSSHAAIVVACSTPRPTRPALSGWKVLKCTVRLSVCSRLTSAERRASSSGAIFGAPSLRPELAPGGLDYIADRMMWLEDYKTP